MTGKVVVNRAVSQDGFMARLLGRGAAAMRYPVVEACAG